MNGSQSSHSHEKLSAEEERVVFLRKVAGVDCGRVIAGDVTRAVNVFSDGGERGSTHWLKHDL